VSTERDMAIVCIVGENLRSDPTLFGRGGDLARQDSASTRLAGGFAPEHHVRAARRGRDCGDESFCTISSSGQ
jgi:hypothetical protein